MRRESTLNKPRVKQFVEEEAGFLLTPTRDLSVAIELYHQALDTFVRGEAEPLKALYSGADDVTLANPFGPPVRGLSEVALTMERAATHYQDGAATAFERVADYATEDLAYTVEIERYRSKVGGGDEMVTVDIRVTTVFRLEGEVWKVVHRHADHITSPRPGESVVAG